MDNKARTVIKTARPSRERRRLEEDGSRVEFLIAGLL
jgi:hypothetical protein